MNQDSKLLAEAFGEVFIKTEVRKGLYPLVQMLIGEGFDPDRIRETITREVNAQIKFHSTSSHLTGNRG